VSGGAHYAGREALLGELFGVTHVLVEDDAVVLDGLRLPVVDGVILALDPSRWPPGARTRGGPDAGSTAMATATFAPDIQDTFGQEWTAHGHVLPEHAQEFADYFDLVDVNALAAARVADLGCGSGRWGTFLAPLVRDLVLVDFSDAIFVARENLRSAPNTVFVLGDVLDLPFAPDAFDLAYSLGVLHHLPVDALAATRRLAPLAPRLLVYLYYALDNRPWYFRALLRPVSAVRSTLARIHDGRARSVLTWVLTLTLYVPLAFLGRVLRPVGLDRVVPLAETYAGKSVRRLRQDAYDRFFTGIEQRFSRDQIRTLSDTFDRITISDGLPYWHFLCERG
jgi:SAM-dependent methyltransferase